MIGRYELLKFDSHIGVFDTKIKRRLKDLYPKKNISVKVKATAYERGYTYMNTTDLHHLLRNKRFISMLELKRLQKKYGEY